MAIETKEITFEQEIEYSLLDHGGYIKGNPRDYNREFAIDTKQLFRFLQDSQPVEWEKLCRKHGENVETGFLKKLYRDLDTYGTLYVLRHGVVDAPAKLSLCYFKPASGMNQTSQALYEKNILSITRQVHYSLKNENSIDVVLFINGLPVATVELKNPITGQTVENAKRQYMKDRDPRELLLSFKARCLVHFAVDTEEVWMTTKHNGINTYFLPFNKGNNGGKGNPVGNSTYRTSYLWEEVLQKDSLLDIVQRFIHLQEDKKNPKKSVMIFPRYHQLDVVRKLVADVYANGTGHNYLIQHSAGSGKSNSISWLAHHLSNLHDKNDKVVFNSIIVITDRLVLDKQLQDTMFEVRLDIRAFYIFSHIEGTAACTCITFFADIFAFLFFFLIQAFLCTDGEIAVLQLHLDFVFLETGQIHIQFIGRVCFTDIRFHQACRIFSVQRILPSKKLLIHSFFPFIIKREIHKIIK